MLTSDQKGLVDVSVIPERRLTCEAQVHVYLSEEALCPARAWGEAGMAGRFVAVHLQPQGYFKAAMRTGCVYHIPEP